MTDWLNLIRFPSGCHIYEILRYATNVLVRLTSEHVFHQHVILARQIWYSRRLRLHWWRWSGGRGCRSIGRPSTTSSDAACSTRLVSTGWNGGGARMFGFTMRSIPIISFIPRWLMVRHTCSMASHLQEWRPGLYKVPTNLIFLFLFWKCALK